MSAPWLDVVGIGADGLDGLSPRARRAVEGAGVLVGGARHLGMVPRGPARRVVWRSPLHDTLAEISSCRGQACAVLASGDPLWFGVGRLLGGHFGLDAVRFHPHVGAFQLAASRLGWALEDVATISLHGRPLDRLARHTAPGRRLLVLTDDGRAPGLIAERLRDAGYGASAVWVLEDLDGPGERLTRATAATLHDGPFADLNTVALHLAAVSGAGRSLAPGLPDDAFDHDGQITKREVRALTVAALEAHPNETLWDVGAGSGSVALEWLRLDPTLIAVAIERDGGRAARLRANARAFGRDDLSVIEGEAPAVLPEGEANAIFVGGGVGVPGLLLALLDRLRPGGRLVANAVTLAGEAALLACHAGHGGDLVRLRVERAEPLGGGIGFRPMRPVTQWRYRRSGT